MRYYDYQKAKRIILEKQSLGFTRAALGMKEDWWWTGVDVWEKDKGFLVDLDNKKLDLAGINGSSWATPSLCLKNDDSVIFVECFTGEATAKNGPLSTGPLSKSILGNRGALSGSVQDHVDAKAFVPEELL